MIMKNKVMKINWDNYWRRNIIMKIPKRFSEYWHPEIIPLGIWAIAVLILLVLIYLK